MGWLEQPGPRACNRRCCSAPPARMNHKPAPFVIDVTWQIERDAGGVIHRRLQATFGPLQFAKSSFLPTPGLLRPVKP